jgi:hypothetical protein
MKCNLLYLRTSQLIFSISVLRTGQLMLYKEVIAVSSEISIKHVHNLYGQNVELFKVKPDDTECNYWALKG